VATTTIELLRLQPLFFLQLVVDGTNYLLWAKIVKAHIFSEQLSDCITFDHISTISDFISIFASWKTLLLLYCHLVPSLQYLYLELKNPNEL